ncbi:hypothetical protein [Trichothermofontia sp.]
MVKAVSLAYGEFLILNELQVRYTHGLPVRLWADAGLATEKYHLPVYPVLVTSVGEYFAACIIRNYPEEALRIDVYGHPIGFYAGG